jgi:hypothetical protein
LSWELVTEFILGCFDAAEEAIDKSKVPSAMVDRMKRAGIGEATEDEALLAEADEIAGGESKPAAGGGDADKQAQAAANRARLQALSAKK